MLCVIEKISQKIGGFVLSGVKGMKVYGEGWIKKIGRLSKENEMKFGRLKKKGL